MIRGLVFDFDGLILDTEWPDYLAWQEVYAERGQSLPLEIWLAQVGMGADRIAFDPHFHLEGLLGTSLDRAELRARRRARVRELVSREEVCPGVREYIAEARGRGLKLAIASSSSRAWVRDQVVRVGLATAFDVILTADDVARTKPSPDLYLAVLDCLGLMPEEALALEDSPNGLRAAKVAGIRCVAVPNRLTRGLSFPGADLILESLAILPLGELLDKLQRDPRHP